MVHSLLKDTEDILWHCNLCPERPSGHLMPLFLNPSPESAGYRVTRGISQFYDTDVK